MAKIPTINLELVKKTASSIEGYIKIAVYVPSTHRPKYQSTGYKILVKDWDKENQIVKRSCTDFQTINYECQKQRDTIEAVFKDALKKDKSFTEAYIVDTLKPKSVAGSFLQFYKTFLELQEKRNSSGYFKHWEMEYRRLEKFAGPNLAFEDITVNFLERYEKSLKYAPTTINTIIKRLNEVINRAIERELISPKQVAGFKLPGYKQPETKYLTLAQTEKIANLLYDGKLDSQPLLRTTAAFFLVECYGGIRFSDWSKFEVEKLIEERNFKVRATKNNQPIYLNLDKFKRLDKIIQYIAANDIKCNLTEKSANLMLKDLQVLIGIDWGLSTHDGRRTCGTLLAEMGYNTRAIALVLGISEQTAKTYIHNTKQELKHVMERFGGL